MKKIFIFTFIFLLVEISIYAQAIPVEITKDSLGAYSILRGGEPFYFKGGGTTNKSRFPEMQARGGNSIRTWGVDATSGTVLKEANKYGLTVMLGLWMKKERDGFDYNDNTKVKAQLESFRSYVRSFRNYPALIAWSIGNEIEVGASNLKMWNAVNDISKMIHEEDPNHLTLTITASISTSKANAIAERAPDLDMLGINNYGGISGMHSTIAGSKWEKPYLITEWGINGPWEVGKTSWGAPRELNSTQKAELIKSRYDTYITPYSDLMPGNYVFYWNSKFEATETWFGLFVGTETTEMIDVLQYCWTGEWPENKAPQISNLYLNSKTQENNVKLTNRSGNIVTLESTDPDGDTLNYEFLILPETGDDLTIPISGASYDAIAGLGGFSDSNSIQIDFKEIHNHMDLRLYALVRDGKGHVGTATFPFQTDFAPEDTTEDPGTTIGIKQSKAFNDVSLFPNPSNDFIKLQCNSPLGPLKIRIYNIQGMLVDQFDLADLKKEYLINMKTYPSAVYLLEIRSATGDNMYFKVLRN